MHSWYSPLLSELEHGDRSIIIWPRPLERRAMPTTINPERKTRDSLQVARGPPDFRPTAFFLVFKDAYVAY